MSMLSDLVLKTSALAVIVLALTALMRGASASARHLVLTGFFAAALVMAAAKVALPTISVFVLAPAEPVGRVFRPGTPSPIAIQPFAWPTSDLPSNLSAVQSVAVASTTPVARTWTLEQTLVLVWAVGFVALAIRAIVGAIGVRRLARRATAVEDPELSGAFARAAQQLGVRRPIALLLAHADAMSMTWGTVRPRILLPASARVWAGQRPALIDAVMLHEVAHVARMDALARAIAQLAVAVFWFNPLFWFAARQARLERERACDDAVLASGVRATDYARDLLMLVESSSTRSAAFGALAMATRSQLERRVHSILDGRIVRRGVSRASAGIAAVLVVATAPVSVMRLAARPATAVKNLASGEDLVLPTELRIAPLRRTTAPTVDSTPAPLQPLEATQQPPIVSPDERWRAERAEMFGQLIQHAKKHEDLVTVVQVADAAAVDAARVERRPSEADVTLLKARFALALSHVEAAEKSLAGGLASPASVKFALVAALAVVRDPAPAAPQQNQPPVAAADDKPRADRLAMIESLRAKANDYYVGIRLKAHTGTLAPVDALPAWMMTLRLDALRRREQGAPTGSSSPSIANLIDDNKRLAIAIAGLDAELRKFDVGLTSNDNVVDAFKRTLAIADPFSASGAVMQTPTIVESQLEAARNELDALQQRGIGPSHPDVISLQRIIADLEVKVAAEAGSQRPGTAPRRPPMSDSALLSALQNAPGVVGQVNRADMLIALAQENAFTPEMVTLYVAAGNTITSRVDKARVFAQPIRVK